MGILIPEKNGTLKPVSFFLFQAWAKAQQYLISKLHPSSHHIVVNGADHHMPYRQPESIIEQIKKIVKARRNKAVLS